MNNSAAAMYQWDDRLVTRRVYEALVLGTRSVIPIPEEPVPLEDASQDPMDDQFDPDDDFDWESDVDEPALNSIDPDAWQIGQDRYENWLFRD